MVTISEIDDVLAENYFGIGAIGRDAINAMWEDFAHGRLDNNSERVIIPELLKLTHYVIDNGLLNKSVGVNGEWSD